MSSAVERDLGFYDAVREQVKQGGGMEVESSSDLSIEEGYRMTKELLRRAKPTALFFGYHRHAQGGVEVSGRGGVRHSGRYFRHYGRHARVGEFIQPSIS